jgi:hypothetical protein
MTELFDTLFYLGKKFVPLQHDIKDLERSLRIILRELPP